MNPPCDGLKRELFGNSILTIGGKALSENDVFKFLNQFKHDDSAVTNTNSQIKSVNHEFDYYFPTEPQGNRSEDMISSNIKKETSTKDNTPITPNTTHVPDSFT